MNKLDMFFRLSKVDPVQGIVQGVAVQEAPDKSGEIFDYATSKAHFEAWSGAIAKATDGENLGNVREMHGKNAIGKLTAIDYDDDNRLIRVTAKIVDEGAKKKLSERIYTGFSIGGKYGKRWPDEGNKELTRYTAIPSELSLVDNPCIPGATFAMVKADGTEETVPFAITAAPDPLSDASRLELSRSLTKGLTDPELVSQMALYADHPLVKAMNGKGAREDAEDVLWRIAARDDAEPAEGTSKYGDVTFADETNKKYPIDTEAHIRAAWNYINKPKNAAKYSSGDASKVKAKIVAAWKKHIDKDGPPSAEKAADAPVQKTDAPEAATTKDDSKQAGATDGAGGKVRKSMSQVCSLAQAIDTLCMLRDSMSWEADREKDGSPLVAQIEELISEACELLRDLADEETEEIEGGTEYFAMAAQVGALRKITEGEGVSIKLHPDVWKKLSGKPTDTLKKLLEKYGARHSKADQQHLQQAHDHLNAMGAVCTTDDGEDGEKAAGGDLQKVLGATKAALEKVTNERDALKTRLESIPRQTKVALAFSLVDKGAPVAEPTQADLEKAVAERVASILALPEDKRAQEINRLSMLSQASAKLAAT